MCSRYSRVYNIFKSMSTLVYHADDDLVWKTFDFDFLNVFF